MGTTYILLAITRTCTALFLGRTTLGARGRLLRSAERVCILAYLLLGSEGSVDEKSDSSRLCDGPLSSNCDKMKQVACQGTTLGSYTFKNRLSGFPTDDLTFDREIAPQAIAPQAIAPQAKQFGSIHGLTVKSIKYAMNPRRAFRQQICELVRKFLYNREMVGARLGCWTTHNFD